MEVFDTVRTVLAVRDYQDKPLPPDLLRRILDAARLTGSSINGQPWHFIVVDDPGTLRRLASTTPSRSYVAQAPPGHRRRYRKVPLLPLRRQPRHPVHGPHRLGRGRRL